MSVGNTNTPNGGSKDLYIKNEDLDRQQLAVTDMAERDPAIDLTGNTAGDNTIAEEYIIIDNTTAIRDFGSVRIGAVLVGQPMKDGPEAKSSIKLSVEEVKKAIQARGALTSEAYIQAKKEKGISRDKDSHDEEALENGDRNE